MPGYLSSGFRFNSIILSLFIIKRVCFPLKRTELKVSMLCLILLVDESGYFFIFTFILLVHVDLLCFSSSLNRFLF